VEPVTDFSKVFDAYDRNQTLRNFNEDVSSWNVANATDFSYMFSYFQLFNSDVSGWNVANATNLSFMFRECESFNSDVSRWNVANATDLSYMLAGCDSFNREFVSGWPEHIKIRLF
jgi:surface protein